mgnify:CR=1 FL=1
MQKWEYRTQFNVDTNQIQSLGMQGWELCGIVSTNSYDNLFYFKRPLVETSIAISNETLNAVGVQH